MDDIFLSELKNEFFEADDLRYNKEDVTEVFAWMKKEVESRRVIASRLADQVKIPTTQLHRFYTYPDKAFGRDSLNEALFRQIVDILKRQFNFLSFNQHEGIKAAGPDHLYFSMAARLQMWNSTAKEMNRVLPGWYLSYRPSRYLPGAVVRGLVRFVYDQDNGPFRSWELQRFGDEQSGLIRRQIHEGYVWRRRSQYIWDDQDLSTRIFRHTVLAEFFQEKKAVVSLTGLSTASWSNGIHSVRVYLERVSPNMARILDKGGYRAAKLIRPLVDVVPGSELDQRIPRVALGQVDPRMPGHMIGI